jgi:hypothetical protein
VCSRGAIVTATDHYRVRRRGAMMEINVERDKKKHFVDIKVRSACDIEIN